MSKAAVSLTIKIRPGSAIVAAGPDLFQNDIC